MKLGDTPVVIESNNDDQDGLTLTWSVGDKVLSINIVGTFEWFYRDRSKNIVDGCITPLGHLSPELLAKLNEEVNE